MEKEEVKNSITDNKDVAKNDAMAKRVLLVGKLNGTKQKNTKTKKTKSPKTTTNKTSQTVSKSNKTVAKNEKPATTKKAEKEATKKVSTKKNEKATTSSKSTVKKVEEKKATTKKTETKKDTTKKAEITKPEKIEIVEDIKKIEKSKIKEKPSKTKRASAQVNVLRINANVEKLQEHIKVNAKNIIIAILVVALAISLIYIGNIGKQNVSNRMLYSSLSKDIKMDELTNKGASPISAIKTLQQENPEIKGWIKIDGTNVDYPLLQGQDNKYYLTHNFKNEKTNYGSIFVNTNSDIKNDKSNVIIYGHDMKDGQMFSDLLKYADKEYYDNHKTIKITTDESENEYTIVSAFKSKVFYKDEKNVFRFYQYYNLENENQFKEYVSNCKKLQLYDTGVQANYGDQLVTLITCEYSNENGRMVVVAKKN